ncbi:MAG: TetR/AcrR family transcriptional regulator [Deltaproteobacteria bacterium]|jgi:AcrR family transcriptional regulator|nr:TetR/AcrR family transcriptional regulator [Deltaproteobacteria bacterium]
MPTAKVSPRKAEIIRIAGELFAEQGFQGTSLRDIGQAVELRRGSLYSHFSSKEEILKMLLAPAVEELIEVLDGVAAQPGTGREKLGRALSEALACGRRHRNAILVLFQDRQLIEDSPVLREVSEAAKGITPKWLSFIAAGQGDGTIRADIAPATIVVALISLLVGALSDRHLGIYAAGAAPLSTPEELGQVAATLIFEGIEPR